MAKAASIPRHASTKLKPIKRAHGRSLEDFSDLSDAESELLRCCRLGKIAKIATDRPTSATRANTVRASFVRFLALGGDDDAPVHEHGVQLEGAWLLDPLDLEAGSVPHSIALRRCHIVKLTASSATVRSIDLRGSHLVDGIHAPLLVCEGQLNLGNDFLSTGRVHLTGASIGGNFQADAGHFECPPGEAALVFDNAVVRGDVLFRQGFHSKGEVRLVGARIEGDLQCRGALIENPGRDALSCHGVKVSGFIYLNEGFTAAGGVFLIGAKVEGSVECDGGSFLDAAHVAFSTDRAEISGTFFFRDVLSVEGEVHLTGMRAGVLCDDVQSWGSEHELILDGFTYQRLATTAPTDAETRIAWLEKQRTSHLDDDFKPQPWEHLIAVLRTMGHLEEARKVAIEKHRKMRSAKRYVGGSRSWDWIYGSLVGYGYRPWSLLRSVAIVWAACALIYWPAANPGLFGLETHLLVPVNATTDTACLISRAAAGRTEPCEPKKPKYEDLFLPAYSAEVLIPVVSLGQKGEWKPRVSDENGNILYWGWALRAVYWAEIFFGWLAGLLLVAAVGNLVKKD